jgi:hypothetical protein
MEKIKRNERLGALTRILMDTPNRIHTLSEFCELFGAAKSTISEDIDLVSASLTRFDLGKVETVAGAAGGVRYRAIPSPAGTRKTLEEVARRLSEPGRIDRYLPWSDDVPEACRLVPRGKVDEAEALPDEPIVDEAVLEAALETS